MRKWVLVAVSVAILTGTPSAFAASSPNASLTPGATDPHVTQATIAQTICTRGYTATVRNVSTRTKSKVYAEYHVKKSDQRKYVIDHLVPLEVGGANTLANLWPEPKSDAKIKDQLESQMHTSVCHGHITLADAQAKFTSLAVATTAPPTAAASTQAPATEPPATVAPATQPPAT